MVENAMRYYSLPLGIATNFLINKKISCANGDRRTIGNSCSQNAKIAKNNGGFIAECNESLMMGQVQIVSLPISLNTARMRLNTHKKEILRIANSKSKSVVAKNFQVREIDDKSHNNIGKMLLLELFVDTKDAMGGKYDKHYV